MSKLTTLSQVADITNAAINKVKNKNYGVGTYTIKKQATAEPGYAHTYQLFNVVGEGATAVETAVGEKINIPKDMVVESATVETVETVDVPYQGAVVGDKYIDMVIANSSGAHVYIPVNDLFNEYSAGSGIDISNSTIAIKIDNANANGLSATANGLKLNVATASTAGAMSAADKTKLDGLSNYDDTAVNNAMVRADAPDEEGFSQLYKTVNGQRVDIDPKTGSSADELTDETFAAKMDEQIGILTNIAKKLGFTEWKRIQGMVRNGTFADHYSVGDQLTVKYNGNDTLWDIVAIDVATPADTNLTHSVTLMPHDCLDALMFDNKEPNNPNSNRKLYGNNRYKESNIRLYLNSSGAAGTWWSSQGTYDAAPDYATTKAGFMSNFESDFLEVIGKTKIRVAKNTVTDGGGYEDLSDEYFYLASETEVGLGNENNIAEGSAFPYFSDNAKRIKNYNGSAKYWWLRTPYASFSHNARRVGTGGSLNVDIAYVAYGLAAACNII